MIQVIDLSKYRNGYVVVEIYNNVNFVIKVLVIEKVFEEILDCSSRDNAKVQICIYFGKKR